VWWEWEKVQCLRNTAERKDMQPMRFWEDWKNTAFKFGSLTWGETAWLCGIWGAEPKAMAVEEKFGILEILSRAWDSALQQNKRWWYQGPTPRDSACTCLWLWPGPESFRSPPVIVMCSQACEHAAWTFPSQFRQSEEGTAAAGQCLWLSQIQPCWTSLRLHYEHRSRLTDFGGSFPKSGLWYNKWY
jgi:hypothetical protein